MRKVIFIFVILCAMLSCSHYTAPTVGEPWPDLDKETVWQLTSIRGREVRYAEEQQLVTIQLNPESHGYSGFAGCNQYFGQFQESKTDCQVSGKTLREFRFTEPGRTKVRCPDNEMPVEDKFLPVLSKVTHYDLTQYSLIFYQNDREVLRFERQ